MSVLATEQDSVVWDVLVRRKDTTDYGFRETLIPLLRKAIEAELQMASGRREIEHQTPLFTIQARHRSGRYQSGMDIRLNFLPEKQAVSHNGGGDEAALVLQGLPDASIQRLSERLVGLDDIRDDVVLKFRCLWDGAIDEWRSRCEFPPVPALQAYLEQHHAVFLFAGDPGVGKSVLAQVIADRYCRDQGIDGKLLWLHTDARGNGLVGNFGNRIRAAFRTLGSLPSDTFRCLVIDEADALAVRRSEEHAHQEDRAGTATLLQCLDEMAGQPRMAVIMTTNLISSVDSAIQRRASIHRFRRPDSAARKSMVRHWLPQVEEERVGTIADRLNGMTPADIQRAFAQIYLQSVRTGCSIHPETVLGALQKAHRTGSV